MTIVKLLRLFYISLLLKPIFQWPSTVFSSSSNYVCFFSTIQAALTPTLYFQSHRTPFYDLGFHTVYTSQPPSQDEKTFSSLKLKMKDEPLSCDAEEDISIQYTIVRKTAVYMDVVYLVSYCLSQVHPQ